MCHNNKNNNKKNHKAIIRADRDGLAAKNEGS